MMQHIPRTCSTICRNILTENFIQMVSAQGYWSREWKHSKDLCPDYSFKLAKWYFEKLFHSEKDGIRNGYIKFMSSDLFYLNKRWKALVWLKVLFLFMYPDASRKAFFFLQPRINLSNPEWGADDVWATRERTWSVYCVRNQYKAPFIGYRAMKLFLLLT